MKNLQRDRWGALYHAYTPVWLKSSLYWLRHPREFLQNCKIKMHARRWNIRHDEAAEVLKPVHQPDWQSIIKARSREWQLIHRRARGGPRVLIATSTGRHIAMTPIESTLAVALTLRGAEVHGLLCDRVLPACLMAEIPKIPTAKECADIGPSLRLCHQCFKPAKNMYASILGADLHRYSEFLTEEDQKRAAALATQLPYEEIPVFSMNDLAVGEHALAGALRFYTRGTLEGVPYAKVILRRYFQAALLTTYTINRLIDRYAFDVACFHHGIYVPQGLIGEVCRKRGIRVVNWNIAYRKQRFIFSHGDTYHHTLLTEPTSVWENMAWKPQQEKRVLEYLDSRRSGANDWIWFHDQPQEDIQAIFKETGVDFSKPVIGLLTNVIWDAQLHYRDNAFDNMLHWLRETINYFRQRQDLQLLIRIHPAEIRGALPASQKALDEIYKVFPILPPNVFVIPPESQLSTYTAMFACDSVIVYGTKTGVELAAMGIPVIVAGEAWIRNKGLTLDASTREEYFRLLDRLPLRRRLDEATVQRARKYAYHFFFRRMIPLPFMKPRSDWPPMEIDITDVDELQPHRYPGLDVICDGILKGTPFIYPEEILSADSKKSTHQTGDRMPDPSEQPDPSLSRTAPDSFDQRLYGDYVRTHFRHIHSLNQDAFESYCIHYNSVFLPLLPKDRNTSILDIGCGLGHFLFFLKKAGYSNHLGIDIGEDQITFCRANVTNKARQIDDTITFLGAHPLEYGAIVSIDVLEHISDADLLPLLDGMYGALQNGGRLLISVPNAACLPALATRYGDLTHKRLFTEYSIRQLLRTAGFSNIAVYPNEKLVVRSWRSRRERWMWQMRNRLVRWLLSEFHRHLMEGAYPTIQTVNLLAVGEKADEAE